MSIASEITRIAELFQLPFMQRAVIGGALSGLTGGILGSFTILRQLSFFGDALGHASLLGISIGIILGWDLTAIVIPFAVLFALCVTYLLEKTKLWTDTLLSLVYSSSLSVAVVILSFSDRYKGSIESLLFGDILAFRWLDLYLSLGLFLICLCFIGLTLRTQILITLNEPLAIAQGVSVTTHRTIFITLLSLVVGISIKAIGVLLISAFIVIPAAASQLLSSRFDTHVVLSAVLGSGSAVFGMLLSAALNWPSGPSIVISQTVIFLGAVAIAQWKKSLLQESVSV
ncbi:MAG: metal ABC transporter permease [Cyanobacteria bacterium P01_F01_bin.42]